jgi:two-component system cell cycle sensor histidine kinase/response regulator CckA
MVNAKRVIGKYYSQWRDSSATEGKPYRKGLLHNETSLRSQDNPLSAKSILFVEDDRVLRTMVFKMLTSLGYSVMTAMHAEEALDVFIRNKKGFDILITDVIMPRMNGKELYRLLKKQKKSLRVLYISGYPEEVLKKHGVKAAHMQLLKKPFTIEKISQKIKQAFVEI